MLFEENPITILCTDCKTPLELPVSEELQTTVFCSGCPRTFAMYAGIVDMRPRDRAPTCWDDALLVPEAEIVDRMLSEFRSTSLEALAEQYALSLGLPPALVAHDKEYKLGSYERERWNMRYIKFCMDRYADHHFGGSRALEAGCGAGGALPHLAHRFETVFGIDVDLPSLLIARKRLLEMDLGGRVQLVAAGLEQSVFGDSDYSFIKCTDVLEHVTSPIQSVAMLHRWLASDGALFVLVPNKGCFFLPEPHVGVWGLQYMPRRLANVLSRRKVGIPYDHVATLPTYKDIRDWLHKAGFRATFIPVEDKHLNPASERGIFVKKLLNCTPFRQFSRGMRWVQPTLEVLCTKTPVFEESPEAQQI